MLPRRRMGEWKSISTHYEPRRELVRVMSFTTPPEGVTGRRRKLECVQWNIICAIHEMVLRWGRHVADIDDEATVRLSVCVIKYHAIKMYGGVEVYLHCSESRETPQIN